MNFHVVQHADFLTLSMKGRLDISTASMLKEKVLDHVSKGARSIILNMAQVDFINSSGLGTLVSILKETRARGSRLVLSNLANHVHEIFEITQLAEIFEIFPVEADAQSALKSPAKTGVRA